MKDLRIHRGRLLGDLASLAGIGATADGGVTRLAFSAEDLAGRAWFRERAAEASLAVARDGAGNLSAVLPCANAAARTVLTGSHLDTVENGGRYDGALGVVAGLEVLRTVRDAGLSLDVHLEAISFTDEEGTILGELGSMALAGSLAEAHLDAPRGGIEQLAAGMARLGISRGSVLEAARDPASLAGFLELHVEQGLRLIEAHCPVGVVTAIVGIRSLWITFVGCAAHAGTQPMDRRADAVWGAAAFVQDARRRVMEGFPEGVMNCGDVGVEPGSFNVVPERVRLAVEFRNGSEAQLDDMQSALAAMAEDAARAYGLSVEIEEAARCEASAMSGAVVDVVVDSARALGVDAISMMSYAGHDAQAVARIAPSAMIFVPSVGGISHRPDEFTDDDDVVLGANVLLQSVLRLADIAAGR